jgi:tetrahydromethanopterin S-methyltransferase subunit A
MEEEYYPWDGEFITCKKNGCIAVVLLNIDYIPPNYVAIYGKLKTENIGIEKIVANVISNPYIRYLAICGNDIKGHKSGKSLIALNKNGIDSNHRIIKAPGAIPYIENLNQKAIERFRNQIEIIDLIDVDNSNKINNLLRKFNLKSPKSFGKPYIAIKIKERMKINLKDKRAIHSKIIINYMGKIKMRGD